MIHITVAGTEIYGKLDTKLTSGSVGRKVEFIFDSRWDNLLKIPVFRVGDESKSSSLDENNLCEFPWELLTPDKIGQIIHIGVCGMKGEETIFPTMYTYVGQVEEGADPNADPSLEPSSTFVQYLIKIAEDAKKTADSVRKDADDGEFDGDDYVMTEQDKEEVKQHIDEHFGDVHAALEEIIELQEYYIGGNK